MNVYIFGIVWTHDQTRYDAEALATQPGLPQQYRARTYSQSQRSVDCKFTIMSDNYSHAKALATSRAIEAGWDPLGLMLIEYIDQSVATPPSRRRRRTNNENVASEPVDQEQPAPDHDRVEAIDLADMPL